MPDLKLNIEKKKSPNYNSKWMRDGPLGVGGKERGQEESLRGMEMLCILIGKAVSQMSAPVQTHQMYTLNRCSSLYLPYLPYSYFSPMGLCFLIFKVGIILIFTS